MTTTEHRHYWKVAEVATDGLFPASCAGCPATHSFPAMAPRRDKMTQDEHAAMARARIAARNGYVDVQDVA
jgi:hypothetical protein